MSNLVIYFGEVDDGASHGALRKIAVQVVVRFDEMHLNVRHGESFRKLVPHTVLQLPAC
jgi:hypothetical protein